MADQNGRHDVANIFIVSSSSVPLASDEYITAKAKLEASLPARSRR